VDVHPPFPEMARKGPQYPKAVLGFRLAEVSRCSSTLSRYSWKGPAQSLGVGLVIRAHRSEWTLSPPFPKTARKGPQNPKAVLGFRLTKASGCSSTLSVTIFTFSLIFLLSSKRPNTRSNHDMALSYLIFSYLFTLQSHTIKTRKSR